MHTKLFDCRFPYCVTNLLDIPRYIKHAFQRMKHGYDDTDSWEIYSFFLNTVKPLLEQYRENHYGVPMLHGYEQNYDDTEKEWNSIIDRMIFLLGEMNENNHLEKDDYLTKDYDKYMNECKDEFFQLFSKYFYYLWD